MTTNHKALLWAAAIIAAALAAKQAGLDSNAAFGITAGLVGLATGSVMRGARGCSGC